MLRDLSLLVSPILALLLVLLTPVSVEGGPHRDQLFDPVFPHVHPGATAPSTGSQHGSALADPLAAGPRVSGGAGAASVSLGAGLAQPGGAAARRVILDPLSWALFGPDTQMFGRPSDPPPDPPPTVV